MTRAERAGDRHRKLAAGEEARGVARQRDEVRFGEAARGALGFERVDGDLEPVRQLPDQEAERRRARQHAGGDNRRNRCGAGGTLAPPTPLPARIGCWNAPLGCVIGSCEAGNCEPILASAELPNMFHCTPSSRLAWRLTSRKRTSSMICCGCSTWTALIGSGPNWRAISTALSSVDGVGRCRSA